ncbi:MAG: DUF4366 domain-containing protein [Lachnospiraceae bacterium]|nr:DUF4366 domain-containing protein [Lachnospiraceae bacterium]
MKKILKKWGKSLAAGMFALCLVMGMGSVTAFAFVDETSETETEEVLEETTPDETEATPFSVSGNGEVLDDISDDSTKEFYTITTANGNTFFLVIDKASSTENVYMLSMIDEYDLQDFIEEEETETAETTAPVVLEETTQTEESEETEAVAVTEEDSGGSGAGILLAVLLIAALGGGGAYYYIRIYKPKKDAEETTSEGLEYENYETRNEDMEDGEDADGDEDSDEE